jgi:hypothetical protein
MRSVSHWNHSYMFSRDCSARSSRDPLELAKLVNGRTSEQLVHQRERHDPAVDHHADALESAGDHGLGERPQDACMARRNNPYLRVASCEEFLTFMGA